MSNPKIKNQSSTVALFNLNAASVAFFNISSPILFVKLKLDEWGIVIYYISMIYSDRITFDPDQCGGRPCIRGMRIRVKDVLEMLAGGATESEILEDFPYLEAEDIKACLEFAAAEMNHSILKIA